MYCTCAHTHTHVHVIYKPRYKHSLVQLISSEGYFFMIITWDDKLKMTLMCSCLTIVVSITTCFGLLTISEAQMKERVVWVYGDLLLRAIISRGAGYSSLALSRFSPDLSAPGLLVPAEPTRPRAWNTGTPASTSLHFAKEQILLARPQFVVKWGKLTRVDSTVYTVYIYYTHAYTQYIMYMYGIYMYC